MRLRWGSATILHECGSKSSLWSTWKGAVSKKHPETPTLSRAGHVESVGPSGRNPSCMGFESTHPEATGVTGHWCFWCGGVEESSGSDIANLNEDFGNWVQKITWMVWYGISHVLNHINCDKHTTSSSFSCYNNSVYPGGSKLCWRILVPPDISRHLFRWSLQRRYQIWKAIQNLARIDESVDGWIGLQIQNQGSILLSILVTTYYCTVFSLPWMFGGLSRAFRF